MMFHVGQKVVCVDGCPKPMSVWDDDAPLEGRIYTVNKFFLRQGRPTVYLCELPRGTDARVQHGDDIGYGAWRFRPVTERKTDISIFTRMLTPKHARDLVQS